MMNRRDFVLGAVGAGALAFVAPRILRAGAPISMTVYKESTCGCCKEWIKHVKKHGFTVKVVEMSDVTPVKRSSGVPLAFGSCHTALVGKYVVEGHVPADLILRMLTEKAAIVGLAVPGMPIGSPGMEQDGIVQKYNVMAWTADGRSRVYASRG